MRDYLIALPLMVGLLYGCWAMDAPVQPANAPVYNISVAQLFGGHP